MERGRIWHRRHETKWAVSHKSPYPSRNLPPSLSQTYIPSPFFLCLVALIYGAYHTRSNTPPLCLAAIWVTPVTRKSRILLSQRKLEILQSRINLIYFTHSRGVHHSSSRRVVCGFCALFCFVSAIAALRSFHDNGKKRGPRFDCLTLLAPADRSEFPAGPANQIYFIAKHLSSFTVVLF